MQVVPSYTSEKRSHEAASKKPLEIAPPQGKCLRAKRSCPRTTHRYSRSALRRKFGTILAQRCALVREVSDRLVRMPSSMLHLCTL